METEVTAPESAPSTTADFAEQNYAALESPATETPAVEEAAPAASPVETPAAPLTEQPTAEELSAAAKFLLAQGHKAKKEDGRAVWLPYGTVEKMLDRYANEHRLTWDGERGVIEKERDQYRDDWAEFSRDFQGDPWAFVEKLAQTDPRYKAILDVRNGSAPRVESVPDEAPQLVLDQGPDAYMKSVAAREAWLERKVEQKLEQRLKPLTEREQRDKFDAEERNRREAYQRQMTEAASWPMFGALPQDGSLTPFQQEVLKEMQSAREKAHASGDQYFRPSLRAAYLEVYSRHQRGSVINELKAQPTSTAVPRTGQETPKKQGPATTAEIAAKTFERLSRGG